MRRYKRTEASGGTETLLLPRQTHAAAVFYTQFCFHFKTNKFYSVWLSWPLELFQTFLQTPKNWQQPCQKLWTCFIDPDMVSNMN